MFTAIAGIITGSACFYAGYNYKAILVELDKTGKHIVTLPKHTFFPQTVQHYTEQRLEGNKYVLYSKYQQCELATHQLINHHTIAAYSKEQQPPSANQTVTSQVPSENAAISQPIQQPKQSQLPEKNNKQIFLQQFRTYAQELITANTCNSVELIHGPIFSKDTPYKSNGETIKNVYTSTLKIGKAEQWLTDRHYTIVVCNRNEGSYLNGFSYRRSHDNKIRFLNNLTSMKKLQEQTGLVFNVQGGQLSLIDYQGIAKERVIGQAKQDVKEEGISPALAQ